MTNKFRDIFTVLINFYSKNVEYIKEEIASQTDNYTTNAQTYDTYNTKLNTETD